MSARALSAQVPALKFISATMLTQLAKRQFTPFEVVDSVELHPSMRQFMDMSTCGAPPAEPPDAEAGDERAGARRDADDH